MTNFENQAVGELEAWVRGRIEHDDLFLVETIELNIWRNAAGHKPLLLWETRELRECHVKPHPCKSVAGLHDSSPETHKTFQDCKHVCVYT